MEICFVSDGPKASEERALERAEAAVDRATAGEFGDDKHPERIIRFCAISRYSDEKSELYRTKIPVAAVVSLARYFSLYEWKLIQQFDKLHGRVLAFLKAQPLNDYWFTIFTKLSQNAAARGHAREFFLEIAFRIWENDAVGLLNDAICLFNNPRESPIPLRKQGVTEPAPRLDTTKSTTAPFNRASSNKQAVIPAEQPPDPTTTPPLGRELNRGLKRKRPQEVRSEPTTSSDHSSSSWQTVVLREQSADPIIPFPQRTPNPPASWHPPVPVTNGFVVATPSPACPSSAYPSRTDALSGKALEVVGKRQKLLASVRDHCPSRENETIVQFMKGQDVVCLDKVLHSGVGMPERGEMSEWGKKLPDRIGIAMSSLPAAFLRLWRVWEGTDTYSLEEGLAVPRSTCLSAEVEETGDFDVKIKISREHGLAYLMEFHPALITDR